MEENSSLFSLSVDSTTKSNLFDTAKWARFLAIVGFVFLGFMLLLGLYMSVTLGRFEAMYERGGMMGSWGIGMAAVYIIFALIGLFPLLYMFRFANLMRDALNSNDQELLNSAFQNLKSCFRFVGIITIIWLMIAALSVFLGVAGLALS
jgi:hypothetical protein